LYKKVLFKDKKKSSIIETSLKFSLKYNAKSIHIGNYP